MTSELARRTLVSVLALSLFSAGGLTQSAAAPPQGNLAKVAPEATKPAATAPPSQPTSTGLSVDDVLTMVKAGLGDEMVILAIRREEKAFDLSVPELVQLKQAGVSDTGFGRNASAPLSSANEDLPPLPETATIATLRDSARRI